MPCSITENKLSISIDQSQMPELQSVSTKVRIFNVKNPSSGANTGTGNFKIESFKKNGILVDINENFGSIGIAAAPLIYRKWNIWKKITSERQRKGLLLNMFNTS